MKVLIWIGCFVGGVMFFAALGAAFGLEGRIFNMVAIAGIFGLAEMLCLLVDKRNAKKRQIANQGYYQYRASLWVCKKCGASNPPDRDSCQRCGTAREKTDQEVENVSLENNVENSGAPKVLLHSTESQNAEADLSQAIKEDEIEIIRPEIIKNGNGSSEVLDFSNHEKQHIQENDIIDNGIEDITDAETTEGNKSIESDGEIAFCRKCGTQLLNDSEFCHKCGCEKVR